MRLSISKNRRKNNKIGINRRSDSIVTLILLGIVIFSYYFFSVQTIINTIYYISLLAYVVTMFFIVKIGVFTGLGLYFLFMFAYVQVGLLWQKLIPT